METNTNPYASPASTGQVDHGPKSKESRVDFGAIIQRWERLRLYYNGFLIMVVLLLKAFVFPRHLGNIGYWVAILFGAFIANLCFFTGPAIGGYGTYFRVWNREFTILLFLAGLGLATLLTITCVANL